MDLDIEIKELTPSTTEIRFQATNQNVLLASDIHFDNPKCNRKKFFADMNEAKETDAMVIIAGDFFCLMQGKYDPRGSKKDIRPEHNHSDYLDRVIEEAIELLFPYKDNIVIISRGNHETSIIKRLETNPVRRLCKALGVIEGPYSGFVRFVSHINNSAIRSRVLQYYHGLYGGVISKGVQGVMRMAAVSPDADVILTGHTHDQWIVPQARYRMRRSGEVYIDTQYHIKAGTYKEEYAEGNGWAVEKLYIPRPTGAVWMNMKRTKNPMELNTSFTLS